MNPFFDSPFSSRMCFEFTVIVPVRNMKKYGMNGKLKKLIILEYLKTVSDVSVVWKNHNARYGSGNTPVHGASSSNGPFVHPGAPISATRTSYQTGQSHSQQSPYGHTGGRHHSVSPRVQQASPHNSRAFFSTETEDWDAADEAWASRSSSKSRDGSVTPHDTRGTPHGAAQRTPRYDEHSRKTPQYDDGRPSSRSSRDYNAGKSPRSVRSTPRTNTSPHSMMLGDSTPLYDEN